ncbi:MAG TPA: immunoglobulin domain-containing protein, partial [Candidatus Cybelea sp.]|nr:immunoglobulin domain-containing protein [Candidatus Cybelea sp.]
AMAGTNADWSTGGSIWRLGYDPERWGMYADMATVTNAIQHGNFDYLTDSQAWDSSISDHVIPNSYYLITNPAFFGGSVWPWVQPENTTQQIFSLPAMGRYNAIPPPVITTQPRSQVVSAGQTATFTVGTTFSLPLYFQWQKNGADISGATSANYTTLATTTNDNGEVFTVVISNDHGAVNGSNATLTVVTSYQSWQLQYFGCTNCPQADPNADPAGTGQNNWFKYIAGLDPTNPASRFVVTAAAVTNPTTRFDLSYGPLAAGRTYRPWFCTNLAASNWRPLTSDLGPVTNAGNATLTDTNPGLAAKFYRFSISYP